MLAAEVRSLHVQTPPRKAVCYKFNVTVSFLNSRLKCEYSNVCRTEFGPVFENEVCFYVSMQPQAIKQGIQADVVYLPN